MIPLEEQLKNQRSMPPTKRRRAHRGSGLGRILQRLRTDPIDVPTTPSATPVVGEEPSASLGATNSADKKPRVSSVARGCGGIFKGAKFCADGSSLVACNEDNALRLFDTRQENEASDLAADVVVRHGGCVYDYCWYPFYDQTNWASCCVLSTSKDHPVQLWDRFTGKLRATYFPRSDSTDELECALSLCFNATGTRIFAGAARALYSFDVSTPGAQLERRRTKLRRAGDGQGGLLSCLASNPDRSGLVAAGSYAKTVCLYVENDANVTLAQLEGHSGGVTQVMFSPDGKLLYSGARMDDRILCWDIRNTCQVLAEIPRKVDTNQRVGFDISREGDRLITGNTHSRATIFKLEGSTVTKSLELESKLDTVNCASFSPTQPELCCITTGRRHFDEDPARRQELENAAEMQLWRLDTHM